MPHFDCGGDDGGAIKAPKSVRAFACELYSSRYHAGGRTHYIPYSQLRPSRCLSSCPPGGGDDEDIEMSPVEPEAEPRRAPEPEGMERGSRAERPATSAGQYAATKKFTLRPFDLPLTPVNRALTAPTTPGLCHGGRAQFTITVSRLGFSAATPFIAKSSEGIRPSHVSSTAPRSWRP